MITEARIAFSALSEQSQARFLAVLAYRATIWARAAYPGLTNDASVSVEGLCSFNELQHKVIDQLTHLLEGESNRYPDDVFLAIIFEMAENARCDGEVNQMFRALYESYLETRKNK